MTATVPPKRGRKSAYERSALPVAPSPGVRDNIPEDAYLGYGRKSTREAERQMLSLKQQQDEVERHMKKPAFRWFLDSQSGTSFDRPGFAAMLEYCRANPQPKQAPRRIVMWDYCRFSRELGENESDDIHEMLAQKAQFEALGWQVDSVRTPRTENFLIDFITVVLKFHLSRKFAEDISKGVIRGKLEWASTGYWLGARAPYPAQRVDPVTKRVLLKGERASQATILQGNPEWVPNWILAAELKLKGWSFDAIAQHLNALGAVTNEHFRDGRWSDQNIKHMLVHPALVGQLVHEIQGERFEVDAKWGPIVPVELWLKVNAVIRAEEELRRERLNRGATRTTRRAPILRPVCARCRAEYHIAYYTTHGESVAYYRHRALDKLTPEQRAVADEAGCQAWTVSMEQLDNAVVGLLRAERTSKEYRTELARARDDQVTLREHHDKLEAQARTDFEEAERAYKRMGRNLALVDDPEIVADLNRELKRLKRIKEEKQTAWDEARKQHDEAASLWKEFEVVVEETEAIIDGWSKATRDVQRQVMDWWVDLIYIQPQAAEPRWKHAKRGRCPKDLVVFLRTNPDVPKRVTLEQLVAKVKPLKVLELDPDDAPDGDDASGMCVSGRNSPLSWQNTHTTHVIRLVA